MEEMKNSHSTLGNKQKDRQVNKLDRWVHNLEITLKWMTFKLVSLSQEGI